MVRGRRAGLLLLLLAWALALAGCVPISRAEQPVITQVIPLAGGQVLGQSLKASYAGLQGVELYLNPQTDQPPAGMLYLHLKATPDAPDLAVVEYPLAQVTTPGYYRFSFPPQPASSQADFYILLKLDGSGRVDLGSAPGDAYLNGSAYAGGAPMDGQLAFQLAYDPIRLAGGLLFEGLSWLVMLFGMGFLLVLPGWALLHAVLPEWPRLGWPEKTVLSAGAALALYPVLFLWAHLIGLAPGSAWAWAPGLLSGGFLIWRTWRRGSGKRAAGGLGSSALHSFTGADFWPNLVFAVIVLVIFGVRFWVIRGIDVPLWGDSYQHTVIAQLMLDSGGLFDSWEPYAPYQSLTVQYGFPALSALWAWLSGHDILKATLVAGQVANGLAVLALYPLALLLARGNRWAGNFSVLAAGLLLEIPAIYLNWGRYAQLSGQAVLPVALALLLYLALRKGRASFGEVILNAVLVSGMLLHYYRMAFYFITFLPVLLILAVPLIRQRAFAWPARLITLAGTAGLALVLLLPWAPNVMSSNLSGMVEQGVTSDIPAAFILGDYANWRSVGEFIPPAFLIAAGLAIAAALVLRRWALAGVSLWVVLLAAIPLGMLFGMPGANMMQTFAVIIFLYAPVGLALGWLAGEAACAAMGRWPRAGLTGVLLAVLLALALGARLQKGLADPLSYAIAVRPDLRAMQWIRDNVPQDAVFLVEGFTINGATTAVGSDGGWWLSLLAGRQNSMPPQYALINERPTDPGYSQAVVDLVRTLEQRPWDQAALTQQLCAWKITHVYIGQRAGRVNSGQFQLFGPQDFSAWPLVYAQDRVRIFAIPDDLCR